MRPRLVALCAASALSTVAGAQTDAHPAARDTVRDTTRGAPAGSAVVRDVVLERRQVFDLTPESAWYERLLNTLHVTTRESAVRRQLLLNPGDPYDSAVAAETERNLRTLNVFRDVSVDSATGDSGLVARVTTADAWTTKPYVSFRSSGGQASYGIGLVESNLLGGLISAGVRFKHEPDRNSVELSGDAPRVIARSVGISAKYANLSDGRRAQFETGLPFLSLGARQQLLVDGQLFDGRVLQFVGGEAQASDSLRRQFALGRLRLGRSLRAGPTGYLRLELTGQIRREDFGAEPPPASFPRTVTGAVLLSAEARSARYIVTRDWRNIGPEEDVDLSTTVRAGASLAPHAWGYERGGIGPLLDVRTGAAFPGGFTFVEGHATTLFSRAGLDSGSFTIGSTTALQPAPRHLAVLYLGGGRQVNPYPGEEFDLGLTRGPRAFPQHAFTGDRFFFGSAEYRWTAVPELLNLVGIGTAAFVDCGGAWFGGSPQRTGTDAGLGVRIGSSRFPSANGTARVDLAYRFPNDVERGKWVIVVGTGFVFERSR